MCVPHNEPDTFTASKTQHAPLHCCWQHASWRELSALRTAQGREEGRRELAAAQAGLGYALGAPDSKDAAGGSDGVLLPAQEGHIRGVGDAQQQAAHQRRHEGRRPRQPTQHQCGNACPDDLRRLTVAHCLQ